MTDDQLLSSLQPSVATVEATRTVLQAQIDTLRRREVSWNAIGGALGISRQAAWERFS
jgi:biotin operon repressor